TFGGLVALQHMPGPLRVLLCAMLVESGETFDATRSLLKAQGWPSEPGNGLEVVEMFAAESVRARKPYLILGVDAYRGLEALHDLPYMFRPYDFATPRQPKEAR